MGFRREWVEGWLREVGEPGEHLLSHAVTAMWKGVSLRPGTSTLGGGGLSAEVLKLEGEEILVRRTEGMALDPDRAVAPLSHATFLALTDRRLLLGSRSGFRNRPKDLLHAAPLDGVRIHWFDHPEGAGNRFRHLLIEFGDGAWRADRSGLSALGKDLTGTSNIHHFFGVVGDRAVPLQDAQG